MTAVFPVILSGGAGTRLWPLSREMYPKQLLALTSKYSMLQDTALRLAGIAGAQAPIVVCNEAHRFTVAEQLQALSLSPSGILLEPIGRNTAPAVAIAALRALELAKDATIVIAPADHVIRDPHTFQRAADVAVDLAESGKLVTFGIVAHAPETGYGYIRRGAGLGPAYPVAQFIEKPKLEVAEKFVASGEYFWNSGMFVFKAERFLAELGEFAPDILAASTAAYRAAKTDLDFVRIDKEAFEACRSESIDYAVMEKTRDAVVLPLDAGWSDVGSWSSLFDALPSDEQGNVLQGDVLVHDTHDCYVHSTSRLVTAVGMNDHIIVETKDAVMVAPKDRVQDVKELVNLLAQGRPQRIGLASRGVPALGQLRQPRRRRPLPGEAPDAEAGWQPVAADASSPRRALDRGAGHRAHHVRRQDLSPLGKRVDLRAHRRHPPDRESGQGGAAHHRGPLRHLPGRGRHRALRR